MPRMTVSVEPQVVRVMQIVVFALISGVVVFAVIAAILSHGKPPGDPFLAYIARGFAVLMIVLRSVIPRVIVASQAQQLTAGLNVENDEDVNDVVTRLCGAYQSRVIMENAMLEGAAFFNLIAYMQATHTWSLGVAAALLAIMAIAFPTRGKVEAWVNEQLEGMP